MKKPVLSVLGLAAASIAVLAGCSSVNASTNTNATGANGAGIKVVATTTQVADLTRAVAGDTASVTQLLKPNTSAHSFDPTPADLLALAEADVLVLNGVDLEEWIGGAVQASGFDGVAIDSSRDIELLGTDAEAEQAAHAEEESDEEAHVDEDAHAGESADEHADHDHDHAHVGGDPHIWTSIRNAELMVQEIADGLIEADPGNASDYQANADEYAAKLAELDAWATTQIEKVPAEQRLLVSNHDSLGYFVRDYGITYVGSVVPSFDDNAELSASDIDSLVAAIKATGTTAVYAEASLSPKSAEAIARDAGVQVFTGTDALYVDSLGPADSEAATYLGAQAHNIRQLLNGWGMTADPLPTALTE
ncbi:metal ABC transporter substrate-binding protein [Diaminobutyricimonas sp. LJ205]|uniref:metal ABC transporter substrate-binding protein n=1 Tax=Diaminobutyricimonas sp. LJ205 TaxID=2683590 RepID=UPI0012F4945B|nr:metal ABC transporter substrate-binding protein [Diaminobutyricimonas sp. LJ205]